MAETTTYIRTGDEGVDTMTVTVDGDETQIVYLTDGIETDRDPGGLAGDALVRYLGDMEAEGYVKQS